MKKQFLTFIFSFIFMGSLLLTSCKSKQLPEETKETIIHKTEVVKDTVLVSEVDSSYYQAYIDCANGKPVLVNDFGTYKESHPLTEIVPKSKAGRNLKIPSVQLKDGLLTVNCEKEAEKLFFHWKETFIKEWQINNKPIYRDKELSTFQNVKMFLGALVFWVLIGVIVIFGIRFLITKKLF